jgi:DNA polymerase-3 subunit delta
MVALKAHQVDAFVARPAQPVVLVFGPDSGLVREARASADPAPRSTTSTIRSRSHASMAMTSPASPRGWWKRPTPSHCFGGRRAVWVKVGSRNIVPAVEALLGAASPDCRVVIEAGDLRRNAPLRALIERAKNAAALPCYEDDEKTLDRLIDTELRESGLAIAPEARAALLPLLGGDRLASRSEITKLALYARGRDRIELDDIMAVVSDASALALDALLDAAFAGKTADVEFQFAKARTAGTTPSSILAAAIRHVAFAAQGAAHDRRRPVSERRRRGDARPFQPQVGGGDSAARLDHCAPGPRHEPAGGGCARIAPPAFPRRRQRADCAARPALARRTGTNEGVVVKVS